MSQIDDAPLNDLDGNPAQQREQPPSGGGTPAGQIPVKTGKGSVSFAPSKPLAKADPVSSVIINN